MNVTAKQVNVNASQECMFREGMCEAAALFLCPRGSDACMTEADNASKVMFAITSNHLAEQMIELRPRVVFVLIKSITNTCN